MYEGNEDDGLLAAGKSREDSLQKINLDLGIGTWASANGGLGSEKITKHEERERPFFTAAQFHEFYNQILVCNYIVCGLPLPFHLFLPIWTTVVRDTLGPAIFKKYPSCKLSLSPCLNMQWVFMILCFCSFSVVYVVFILVIN